MATTAPSARQRGQAQRTVAGGEAEREQPAGHRDGTEEDRIQQHEEGEQRARGGARVQPGAAKGPDRERRAADAARGQQARGRCAAEGHLGARAQSQPRGGAAADEPQERDVAREGKQLERGAGDDPAGIGVEDTAKGVGEGLQRPTGQDDHGDRDGREGGRERCAARQRAQVELRKHILGRGLVVSDVFAAWEQSSGGVRT